MGAPRIDRLDFNPIINGTFEFAQRSSGLFLQTSSAVQYGALDRWYLNRQTGVAGAGQLAMQINSSVPTEAEAGFPFRTSMFIGVNQVRTTLDPQFHQFGHVIEGNRFAPLAKKKLVYQFWTRCNVAGTYPVVFNAPASTFKWLATYQDAGSSVWTKRQVAVDWSSHPGAVFQNNDGGLRITHWLYGSALHQGATANQWISGTPSIPASGLPAFMDGLGSTLNITGAIIREVTDDQYDTVLNGGQIELGFSRAGGSYAAELALCQRYYEQLQPGVAPEAQASTQHWRVVQIANDKNAGPFYFAVEKRANPTVTIYHGGVAGQANWDQYGTSNANLATISNAVFTKHFTIRSTAANALAATVVSMSWAADAEL